MIGDRRSFKVAVQKWGHLGSKGKAQPMVGVWEVNAQKLTTPCENTLFCHDFENDIAIFAFVAYKCSI